MKRGGRSKETRCERCAELEGIILRLERANARLERRVKALEERLRLNSKNSSLPPSRDPLDAPPGPSKPPTGRRRGGQPGHKGAQRELLPVEECDKIVRHDPSTCECCQRILPETSTPADPPPIRHQVWELQDKPYTVTEHQIHGKACECGAVTWAELPSESSSAFGPRLVAFIAAMTGVIKASRRSTQEFLEQVLGIPISLGSTSELEREVSDALAEAHEEVGEAVREASRKNVDETSWKKAGKKQWLWVAATTTLAFFVIHERRGRDGFAALLGKVKGMITTDRWHVYATVKNRFRQICWAHLKRDFKRLAERSGEAGKLGEEALELVGHVFLLWHDFKGGSITRETLKHAMRPLKRDLHRILERGVALRLPKVSTFCQNLLDLEPALWNFAKHEDIEPTNNHAERVIRAGVLWRKNSFGCDSERGCRYVERMLTAGQSCRLQKRSIYTFLVEALSAHRTGRVPPSLLAQNA